MALGADISLAGEHRGAVNSIPVADMIAAFRYVFGAAAALMAGASLCMVLMEERPLAGPGARPGRDGGVGRARAERLSLGCGFGYPRAAI